MVRRVDRIKDTRARALRTRRTSGWPHETFAPESLASGGPAEAAVQDSTSRMSLARRLEQDRRGLARAANWLFIKGGIAILFILGLIVLGLIGVFL
jgi:hypothetical protein